MPYQVLYRDPKTGELKVSRIFAHEWEARRFVTRLAKEEGVEWWNIRWISPV